MSNSKIENITYNPNFIQAKHLVKENIKDILNNAHQQCIEGPQSLIGNISVRLRDCTRKIFVESEYSSFSELAIDCEDRLIELIENSQFSDDVVTKDCLNICLQFGFNDCNSKFELYRSYELVRHVKKNIIDIFEFDEVSNFLVDMTLYYHKYIKGLITPREFAERLQDQDSREEMFTEFVLRC